MVEYEVHYNIDCGFGFEHTCMSIDAKSPDEAWKKLCDYLNYEYEFDFSDLEIIRIYIKR